MNVWKELSLPISLYLFSPFVTHSLSFFSLRSPPPLTTTTLPLAHFKFHKLVGNDDSEQYAAVRVESYAQRYKLIEKNKRMGK